MGKIYCSQVQWRYTHGMSAQLISADDHIDLRWLPRDVWTARLPSAFRARAPHVEDTDSGPYWFCDGQKMGPWGAYTAAQGSGAKWAIESAGVMEEGVLRPTVPELRLADMDRDGIQASIMYGPTDPFVIADPELRQLCYRAFDDFVFEFSAASPQRLIAVAQLSPEDPAAARDELERVLARGARHVNILAARANPPVYDTAWDPFWALAEEAGIPVGFHLAVIVQRERAASTVVARCMGAINTGPQLAEPIVGLIMTGTLDRYPRLKVVMAESGLAWIPHVIQTLDRAYERFYAGKSEHPRMRPSEYFERQIWMTFQEDPYGIKMLPLLYEDRVMWASDYPHPASTWPNSQKIIDSQVRHLPEASRRKLLYENARQLYGL
jgi:uncharacterized protein